MPIIGTVADKYVLFVKIQALSYLQETLTLTLKSV